MNYKAFGEEYNKHVPIHEQHRSKTPPAKEAKPLTVADILPNFDRWSIGYTSAFEELQRLAKAARTSSYPPYNIIKFGEGKFQIRIAVAGFRREEIKVSVEERTLTVESDTEFKLGDTREIQVGKLLHQGIAERDFKQTFALAEYVEVENAKLEDGILTIDLFTNIPDEKKPKIIDIQ